MYKHLNKGMTIAYVGEIKEASDAFVLSASATSTSMTVVLEPIFDVNPSLPMR